MQIFKSFKAVFTSIQLQEFQKSVAVDQGGKGGNKFIYPLEGGVTGFGIITVIQNLFSDIFCCHA
jgi:hypothetical protein